MATGPVLKNSPVLAEGLESKEFSVDRSTFVESQGPATKSSLATPSLTPPSNGIAAENAPDALCFQQTFSGPSITLEMERAAARLAGPRENRRHVIQGSSATKSTLSSLSAPTGTTILDKLMGWIAAKLARLHLLIVSGRQPSAARVATPKMQPTRTATPSPAAAFSATGFSATELQSQSDDNKQDEDEQEESERSGYPQSNSAPKGSLPKSSVMAPQKNPTSRTHLIVKGRR